jgi:hypothetical protein
MENARTGTLWRLGRYIVAILIAVIVGQIVQIAAALIIDAIVGHEVTGGRWPPNVENVIVACIQGAAVGIIAGAIARKRGILISAIAIFLPLEIFALLELIKNRDMSDYIASVYDTKPALWIWIALVPAMICGHSSARLTQNKQLLSASACRFMAGFRIFVFWVFISTRPMSHIKFPVWSPRS